MGRFGFAVNLEKRTVSHMRFLSAQCRKGGLCATPAIRLHVFDQTIYTLDRRKVIWTIKSLGDGSPSSVEIIS
jgi:hypothetical protein